jgi:hypothetical protein
MKLSNFATHMILVLLFSGCAPLQQAPLIYSSKTSVGVDVSTPTSEQPGISISIGFKMVDAAYVPVAVAKECDTKILSRNCEDDTYKIRDVTAYNNSDDSKLPDMRTAEAREIFSRLTNLASERDLAKARVEELEKQSTKNEAAINNLTASQDYKDYLVAIASTTAPTPAQLKANAQYLELVNLRTTYSPDTAKKALQHAEEMLVKYVQDPKINNLAANLKLIASIDAKQDAYSVFGSFDGKAGANGRIGTDNKPSGEASLVVGKVFSTGVASQFLTQGLKALYAGKGNSACLTQAATLRQDYANGLGDENLPDVKKKMADFASRLVTMCSATPLSGTVAPAG